MEKVIHDENLRLFRKRLAETTDEKQRQVLHDLIAEHESKFREWQLKPKPDSPFGALSSCHAGRYDVPVPEL
jgi:hypothetical protein